MKTLFLSIIVILTGVPGFSQKQFEGTIVYNLHSTEDESKEDGELSILFGKNAVKLKFKEKDRYDKTETLIRLDSGKIYVLNSETKTFRPKKMKVQEKLPGVLPGKKLSGYSTSAMKVMGNTTIGSLAAAFKMEDVIIYIADSLYYTIPEKYVSNIELAFLHQGKIILGAEMKSPNYFLGDDQEDGDKRDARMNIVVEAKSVKWEVFKDNEFSIPADYVKHKNEIPLSDSASVLEEQTMNATDSIIEVKPVETIPAKKSPTNRKQPAKPKTKTKSSQAPPIRKPE